jgi:hypothetical protein
MASRPEIGFGTSFPTADLADNLYFYRTDLDALFVYDSTHATPGWRVAITNVGDVINGNYLKVNDDGFVELVGNAQAWEDYRVTVHNVRVPASNFPAWTAYSAGQVLAFEYQAVEGNEEEVFIVIQVPHSYKEGSTVYPHFHCVPETNDSATFRFGLEYEWVEIDAQFSSTTTIYVDTAINNDGDRHISVDFPAISGTGKGISSLFLCRLFRNSSHANDDFDDDVYFIDFDLHYQRDAFGSRQVADK